MNNTDNWYTIETFTKVPSELKPQVSNVGKVCFVSGSETPEDIAEHEDKFHNFNVVKTVLALEDGNVIGRARVFKRPIQYLGKDITLGGLGDIGTLPEKRRKGVGTAMVQAAFEELYNLACDIAYLCTDVNDPGKVKLYNKVGFIPLGKPHTFRGASGKKYIEHDAMIAPVQSEDIFKLVLEGSDIFDIGEGNW